MKLVSECLGVSRSQLTVRIKQSVSPKLRRRRFVNDTELVAEIKQQVSELPSYGYRRVGGCCAASVKFSHWPRSM
ncbi:hypothetical protein ALP16_200095 [Pseudomonas savastanoi]|uniref:Transposase n=1 Tax=Pseudomonas savastanoi TaxID=29438 RepID=A0A3M6AMJ4_PSESS|nr:hypothetical protein ALP16_200095 [Pseudomonas savastanoi]